MLDRLLAFERALRDAGIPVSVSEGLDALRALQHVSAARRSDFKSALATTMVKDDLHRHTFDVLFDLYFGTAPEGSTAVAATAAAESLDDFLGELGDALAAGDAGILGGLVRRAVDAFGRVEASPSGDWYSYYQVVRTLDLPVVVGNLVRAANEEGESPRATMLRREEFERRVQAFKDALLRETRRRVAAHRGHEAVAQYAVRPPLQDLTFLSATAEEMSELRRAVRPLARKLAARVAMKRRRARRGALDVRRTLRRSLSTGGVPFDTSFRHRPPHRPELFVLCDISGSVARFARFGLMLTHALSAQFQRVRSFAFVDSSDEITSLFEHEDFAAAVERMHHEADVVHLDGHSDYGTSLEHFWEQYGMDLSPKATVLILGDARTNYRATKTWALAEIAGRAGHVYWLNPEPAGDWDGGDSTASEYAAHVDRMVEVRTLRQLEDFIATEL